MNNREDAETIDDLLAALRNLCPVFSDVCERTGYNAGEYYSYRVAQAAIEKVEGVVK